MNNSEKVFFIIHLVWHSILYKYLKLTNKSMNSLLVRRERKLNCGKYYTVNIYNVFNDIMYMCKYTIYTIFFSAMFVSYSKIISVLIQGCLYNRCYFYGCPLKWMCHSLLVSYVPDSYVTFCLGKSFSKSIFFLAFKSLLPTQIRLNEWQLCAHILQLLRKRWMDLNMGWHF